MFELDPDRPTIPPIARILSLFGILSLIGSIGSMLLAFSGFPWVNPTYAMAGAPAAFLLALVLIGQAKTMEMLAVVSARVKSRFAIEHAILPATGAATPTAKPATSLTNAPPKERVIAISEETARQQGLAPVPRRGSHDPI